MIPADLASRLRLLTEASFFNTEPPVAGLQRAREIQSQLPDLVPGQRFFATLQRALPDGSFRAIIAGQQMTLSLDASAKAGDTLELVVTETTPRAVFARLATPETAASTAGPSASAQPTLSQAGRLISFLLTGQPGPQPSLLAGNTPLLGAPPVLGEQLAGQLRAALRQSGLFYESHLADLVLGKASPHALRQEPQAQAAPPTAATAGSQAQGPDRPAGAGSTIPDRLVPIVHQQLEALASHQYVLHGQAWPGQAFEWLIEDPEDGGPSGAGENDDSRWRSTLRLTLPSLGHVEAELQLSGSGLTLRLRAEQGVTLDALSTGSAALAARLRAADLRLVDMRMERIDDHG